MFSKVGRVYFLIFSIKKILITIVRLFFSYFSQSPYSDGKFIPSQIYLSIKGLIFVILCESFFLFLHDFTRLVQCIESICFLFHWSDLLLLFCFSIQSAESIWSITFKSYFMKFVLQQISTMKDKITTFYWCFQPNLITIKQGRSSSKIVGGPRPWKNAAPMVDRGRKF